MRFDKFHRARATRWLLLLCLALFASRSAAQEPQPSVAYARVALRLRAEPDTTARILAIVPVGATLSVSACENQWCHVTFRRFDGYVIQRGLTTDSTVAAPLVGKGYINSRGQWVPSPQPGSADQPPAGATARCRDGTYSYSQSRRGTCSHHGGVAVWL
jgi:hypothetical protein